MRKPLINPEIFKGRQKKLGEKTKGAAIILTAAPDVIRNYDVHHYYRQDSNFFYMTGFEEPESIFIFRPGQTPETVMFVLPRDPLMETWDGFRFGPEGVKKQFMIDEAYNIDEFEKIAPKLLMDCNKVYYSQLHDMKTDERIHNMLAVVRKGHGRKGLGNLPVEDTYPLIGEMRIRKSAEEVEWMRKSAEINIKAHIDVMKATKPGVNERYLYGVFMGAILKYGAPREAYRGIFAAGKNATTLHYTFNDEPCNDGELLLVDAGCEYHYFASDITRTYPINGKFNPAQKRIYQRLYELQLQLIKKAQPGIALIDMQNHAVDFLTDVMLEEGLLKGSKQMLIEKLEYKKYYPHGVSHLLGMDVHDAGLAHIDGKPRKMEAGYAFTIEPGIYIPVDDQTAPKELRGLGMRIEDDVVLTPTGCEVLTDALPKDIASLESLIGKA